MKLTSPHISFAALVDVIEGRISTEQSATAQIHLAACERCEGELSRLEHVLGLMRTDTAADAPRDVIARAVELFVSQSAATAPRGFRKIIAALDFDSLGLQPAYGVRSGQSESRQLLFSADTTDVDLRVAQRGDAWVVSGQVLGDCAGGGAVKLFGENGEAHVELDDLCEFTLPPVPRGNYLLSLRFADIEIEVPQLELGGA